MSAIARLSEAGWLSMPSALSTDRLAAAADGLAADGADAGSRRMLDLPWCAALVPPIRSRLVAHGLLPADAVAVQCTAFRKTPDCNWKVPYHQDLSIPVAARVDHPALSGWSMKEDGDYVQPPVALLDALLAVRLHLDPCDADSGALRVVPGSHRAGRLAPDAIAALDKRDGEVACHAGIGDLVLMRPLLLHASSKARRPNGRRVLHFLFAPPDPGVGLRWRIAA